MSGSGPGAGAGEPDGGTAVGGGAGLGPAAGLESAEPGRTRLVPSMGWSGALLVLGVASFAALAVVLPVSGWLLTTFGPVRSVPAVVTFSGAVRKFTPEGGTSVQYVVDVRTDGGDPVRAGTGQEFSRQLTMGQPVVLVRSEVTSTTVGVRTVDRYLHRRPHAGSVGWKVVGLALVVPATAAPVGGWAWWLWRNRDPAVIVATAVVLTVLVVVIRVLPAATVDRPRTLPAEFGMGGYGSADLPEQTAAPGGTVEVGDVAVEVTGAVERGAPAGSPSWLRGFHLVVVPVWVSGAGGGPRSRPAVHLIGRGPGRAQLVPAAACGDGADVFGDRGGSAEGTDGRLCFAVPPGFQPRYLILSARSRAALRLTADRTAAGRGIQAVPSFLQ